MKRGLVALVVNVRREGSLLCCCFPWPSSLTFWAQCVFVFVCVLGGGGGGVGRGLGPASTLFSQIHFRNTRHSQKIIEFLATPKICSILYLD